MKALRRGSLRETFGRGAVVAATLAAFTVVPLAMGAPAHAADGDTTTLLAVDFEDGSTGPLVQSGAAGSVVTVDGGNKAYEVAGRTQSYDGLETPSSLLAGLPAGTVVTVSMKAMLAAGTTGSYSARWVAKPTYSWISGNIALSATAWTTITGTYTVGDSGVTFYTGTGADSGDTFSYLLDDITVTVPASGGGPSADCPGGYPTADPVISSDFEDGTADGWVPRADGSGQATLTVVDGGANGSAHALEATDRKSQGEAAGRDVTCVLRPSTTYEFDADIRFAAGQDTDSVVLSLANTAGDPAQTSFTNLVTFTTVTNTDWTHVTGKFTMPAQTDSAMLYLETTYTSTGTGNTSDLLFDNLQVSSVDTTVQDLTPIKDTLPFPVGTAVSDPQITGTPGQLVAKHFDQVTPENAMKPESWYDADHGFKAENDDVDQLMTFAQDNHLRVYGHNLVWYQQTPDWFFQDDQGNWLTDSDADKQIMRDRLDTHIKDVAQYLSSRFGAFGSATNPLVSFDVVNEAVSDNTGDPDDLRQSHWYAILGPEYIKDAFEDANKYFDEPAADGGFAADGTTAANRPIALFYNDYNTEQSGKRDRVLELIHSLIDQGVPVDGIGHQFHVTLSTPVATLQDAIEAFQGIRTATGHELYQAVTELDVPTGTPVTEANLIDQGYYYKSVFDMLRSEYAADDDIFSATVWGLTDGQSWRASSGAPLLFDDDLQAKPAYYGVTDQALPAKQLSAVVFQQDASDVDASSAGTPGSVTGNVEWSQLPLHQVGDDAGFQLRWTGDHLTAYVSSTDATDDATDAATLTWGSSESPSTATVTRDGDVSGDGVTAKVSSTASGWKAVVDLPLAGLTASSTPRLDVTVTNGSDTEEWNTPGSLGTLQLVEPLSFTTVPEAVTAPTIDGAKDAAWSTASVVTPAKLIQGTATGTTAKIYQLWQGDYLYVLADVTDATPDTSSGNAYEQDSLEIFTDLGNAKNGSYRPDDAQMRISADNAVSFGGGDTEAAQQARLQSATSRTDTGYIVEARIDLKDTTGVGRFEGLDYEINDGAAGKRVANYGWAEQTGTAYQTTSRWGVAELAGPAQYAPAITTQPVSTSGHPGTTVRFSAAADARPAATVGWQHRAKGTATWAPIAGATGTTLSVKVNASLDGDQYRAVFTNSIGSTATSPATLAVDRGKP